MAKVGVFGTAEFHARLDEQGQAGGDLSWVRLGPVDGAGAAAGAAECEAVVAACEANDPRSLARVQEALPRLAAPCLVVVDHSGPEALVALLAAGAAEAVSASLSAREIVAHLRVLLRRSGVPAAETPGRLAAGRMALDRERYEATVDGRPLELTPREFSLLAYLLERAGRACRREELAQAVWEGEVPARSRTIDVHVGRLRGKLEGSGVQVTTLAGVGYRLEGEPHPLPPLCARTRFAGEGEQSGA